MRRDIHPDDHTPREVLVVEDEPQMRALLTDNLEFEGYHVTAVENAEDALVELGRRAVSLAIVDVMLPGMSGFTLCERLRTQGAHVPIILLTARKQSGQNCHFDKMPRAKDLPEKTEYWCPPGV